MSDASPTIPAAFTMPRSVSLVGGDRLCWIGSVAIAAILFALLANEHWVPGGDSELYLATARNLLLHHFSMRGYLFNGQPLTISPPGWPYILAAAMTISTRFWFLKSILMASMLGSLAMAYPICRRFAPPMICGIAIVFTALTSHVFPLTFWLHSDAVFCLFTTASFLVALQIGEGRTSTARIVLLCVLCVIANTLRYSGPFNWLIIAAALLRHQWSPIRTIFRDQARRRIVVAVIATFAVTASTFLTWQAVLHVSAAEALLIRDTGGGEDTSIDSGADATARHGPSLLNSDEKGIKGFIARPFLIGNWYSYLYWQPFRFAAVGWLNLISLLFGWAVFIPLVLLAIHELKGGRPFWMGVLAFGVSLGLYWPHANARYFVPIEYLLLIGLWIGAMRIAETHRSLAGLMRVALVTFAIGFVICNGAFYGIEVWAQRSRDFYSVYEAGLNKDLINASTWIVAHHPPAGEAIAVSQRYVNMSKIPKSSYLGLRVTTMLTGRPIRAIPMRYLSPKPTTEPSAIPDYLADPDPVRNGVFLAWARKMGVRYYLYQPPVSPWRALHFRVPWLQEMATKQKPLDTGAGWRLYRIPTTGPSAERILPLPESGDRLSRVPGL